MSYITSVITVPVNGATSSGSLSLPANACILNIIVQNTTANAITGGLKFGTTVGGTDVVATLAVSANANATALISGISKMVFSAAQTIYYDAIVSWNSANVNIKIIYVQMA